MEMALLLPVLLFALLAPVYMGYAWYAQTREASVCGFEKAFCAEDKVRGRIAFEDFLEEWK